MTIESGSNARRSSCTRRSSTDGIRVVDRVRAEPVAHATHEAGGFEAVAGDVADDEHERAPFDGEGVVPVAADVDDHVGGAVDGGELDAFDLRQPFAA